jgi:hypothetical protein
MTKQAYHLEEANRNKSDIIGPKYYSEALIERKSRLLQLQGILWRGCSRLPRAIGNPPEADKL